MDETRERTVVRGLLAMLAETSVHAGTGSQLGAVDLPIQRERHTGWPTIYGTGLKGVLRDEAAGLLAEQEVIAIFGPPTDKRDGEGEEARHAGALAISDARLLLFPVRTVGAAFAWVTCPLALARLRRDAAQAGLDGIPSVPEQPTPDRVVVTSAWKGAEQGVFLEEFSYEAVPSDALRELARWIAAHCLAAGDAYTYWRGHLEQWLALVPDEDFGDLVRHATEVVTRVRLERDTKKVERGALWTEEQLPSDTVLYSFAAAWPASGGAKEALGTGAAVLERLRSVVERRRVIQVGGKETVGRGFMAVRLLGGNHG
jgi:CRISPR-associated protein Cmr4